MKTWKFLLALPILFCLCFAGSIQQYQAQIIKMKKAAGGACDTAKNDMTDADTTGYDFAKGSTQTWYGGKFTAGSDHTICKVSVRLKRVDTLSINLRVHIFTHDAGGDEPQASQDSSDYVDSATIGTSYEWVDFTNISVAVTNTSIYWVIIECETVGDATHYMTWAVDSTCAVERIEQSETGGDDSWTNVHDGICLRFITYST